MRPDGYLTSGLLLGCLLLGCLGHACTNDPAGLSYTSVTLSATNAQGESTPGECTTLPILLGSHAMNTIDFDGQFEARVFASAREVEISFTGIQDPGAAKRTLSAEQLDAGYAETVTLVANDGQQFDVLIGSGCAQ